MEPGHHERDQDLEQDDRTGVDIDDEFRLGVALLPDPGAAVASAAGDLLLMPDNRATFLAGLSAFLCGHLLYGIAFVSVGGSTEAMLIGAVPAIILAVLSTRWLLPHLDRQMKLPVLAYIGVIAGMLVCAAGTWTQPVALLAVTGAWGFALSDLAVARQQFVTTSRVNPLWGTPLYFCAQLLLAASVLTLPA